MFAEHNDPTKPKLEGSSHLFPLFSLSADEAQGGTNSQEHIFYNMLSKVKLVSKTQFANGQIKEEELV